MQEVKIYNSLTDQIETFVPLKEGEVSMYVCGPTVWNNVHTGNMRPVVIFDVLKRFFNHIGYKVTHVSNITDVDDKIIMQAIKEQISENDLTKKYAKAFFDAEKELNVILPDYAPLVTENMDGIIEFIAELINKGYAYEINGDVYFRVGLINDYGRLANLSIDDLRVGARIEENSDKENPLDFTLWKKTDEGVKWNSPWSNGRPGWHTECVVMINSIFNDGRIDIHGGGFDLKFPHHENEMAQSKAIHDHGIATYWMHNGFLNINNEKMSKSLGNVITAKDFLEKYGGNILRLALLSTHYRAPLNFSDEVMTGNVNEFNKVDQAFRQGKIKLLLNNLDYQTYPLVDKYMDEFDNALANDLNTSNALGVVYATVKDLNGEIRKNNLPLVGSLVKTLDTMLSILGFKMDEVIITDEDRSLLDKWNEAKNNKDFVQADEIRKILIERKIL